MRIVTPLCLVMSLCSSAWADCPDRPVSCQMGAVGTQGTCWNTRRLSCRDCGPQRCPTAPTTVPKNYRYPCADIVLADKVQVDGCSNPLTDSLSTLYKRLFRPACVQHDLCYHNTIGISKASCDNDFKTNMTWICQDYYRGTLNATQRTTCLTAVGTWFAAVSTAPLAKTLWDQDHAWTTAHCPAARRP